jgi:cysteine sulfinate desulfinase/cysteine desulfurase-like protein
LNTVSVSFRDVKVAQQVIPLLGDKVACSAGAACHSHGTHSVSAVLLAIKVRSVLSLLTLSALAKVPPEYQLGTLRLSFGRHTTQEEIIRAVAELSRAVSSSRAR